jgi:hypothetical protein
LQIPLAGPNLVSRRRFLASAGAVLGLAPVLSACGGGPVRAASCEGYAALDAVALQMRHRLEYVDEAPNLAQQCSTCRFYQPPVGDSPCGGCQLFAGPVAPGGHCTSWIAAGVS